MLDEAEELMPFWSRWFSSPPSVPERVLMAKSVDAPRPFGSTQLKDIWGTFYERGMAIEPLLHPESMIDLLRANEVHASCIGAKTADAAGQGFRFDPLEDVEDPDPAEVAGLARRLNLICPEMPFVDMLMQAVSERETVGWSAWEVIRDESQRIAALYPMRAHTLRRTKEPEIFVQVREGRTRYFKAFGYDRVVSRSSGTVMAAGVSLPPDEQAVELIWFSSYAPESDWYGIPGWVANLASLAELGSIRDYNIEFFDSAGVIAKIIALKTKGNAQKVVAELEATIKANRGKNHKSVIVELPEDGTLQVEDLGADVQDAKFQERRTNLNESVLIAHQVPPYRIGWAKTGSLGGSSSGDMMAAYNRGVVEPIQRHIEHRIGQTLFGPKGYPLHNYEFKLRNLYSEDETEINEATKGVAGAVMTPNEARQHIGLEPLPDPLLDRVYFNGKPLDTSGEAAGAYDVVRDFGRKLNVALQPAPPQAPPIASGR